VNTLAIDIGGTKFTLALFEDQRMTRRESRATDRPSGREWMLGQIEAIAFAWKREGAIDRCGIGFGGPVDFARQRVALSTHVGGWQEFPLSLYVQNLLGVPTIMDNDANAGALGEARYGAGQSGTEHAGIERSSAEQAGAKRGARPLFYMTLSTGIGGGIILEDGSVYRGADSWAGEIGHLTIQPSGPECLCGARGCLERLCGGLWLERDYGRPARELLHDATFVERYVVNLAQGLKAAVMLLNPARVVIGGGIAKAGDALFVPLRAELRRQVTSWSSARLEVVPAQLEDDSVLWGALALAEAILS
jgi:glucokinase